MAKALIAAQYNGISFEVPNEFTFGETNKTPEFAANFPLGKVPALNSTDGPIFESNAIAYYAAGLKADTQLLGKSHYERSLIQQYLAFSDNEIATSVSAWLYPILGYIPYNKAAESKAKTAVIRTLTAFNTLLATRTFLVGECVTLADIVAVCSLVQAYQKLFDASFRSVFPNVNRWFVTCVNQPQFKNVLGDVVLCVQQAVFVPKPKEEAPKVEKPKSAEVAPKTEKKKNPLDLLPESSFDLEAWKRFYSNNETRPDAVEYFWKNFDSQGYSIWHAKYKYNNELARIFMSSNLLTGLYARMGLLRKYCFASFVIFGVDNANEISGVLVFRGKEIPFEMTDVADYDCYTFEKLDTENSATRELINDYFAWEGKFEGVTTKPAAEGKVFK